jgi:hypothetical protein
MRGKKNFMKEIIKAVLLGMVALCVRMQISARTGPMLWINCPIFQPRSVPCLTPNIPFLHPP